MSFEMLRAVFEDTEDALEGMSWRRLNSGVLLYKTREIRSGDMLEVISYPVLSQQHRQRAARMKPSSETMLRINREERRRRIIRLAQCNFSRKTSFVTLTYEQDPEEEAAIREMEKYLRRLKYAAGKAGKDLKYIAVTEIGQNGRVHHHVLCEGVDREIMEKKWRGGFANARRYQENPGGFQGLVRYMLKKNSTLDTREDGRIIRRVRCSQGMIQPDIRERVKKISIHRLGVIAEEAASGSQETLERVYGGYVCQERPRVKTSLWLPGCYMYAVMWKKRE